MGSRSCDLGAELKMHSFSVYRDTFSDVEKSAVVVPVTSVEGIGSETMLALCFSTVGMMFFNSSKCRKKLYFFSSYNR